MRIEVRETPDGPACMTVDVPCSPGRTCAHDHWLRYRGERYRVRTDAAGLRFVDLSAPERS